MSKCIYPDWEGENTVTVGDHIWDKDGVCVICGEERDA